jgi:uncharacterized phage-associated protein
MSPLAPYDSRAVANFLLDLAEERKLFLTQLSLYKIIYFAHGWYLSSFEEPLILQDFEAWKFGPVVKVLHNEFGRFRSRPITARARKLDIYSNQHKEVTADLAMADKNFVVSTFDAYHVHDAWKLSEMTHEIGSPWDLLWNASEPTGRLGLRLRNREIKAHFDGMSQRFRLS